MTFEKTIIEITIYIKDQTQGLDNYFPMQR
jgi:hypothetical protein